MKLFITVIINAVFVLAIHFHPSLIFDIETRQPKGAPLGLAPTFPETVHDMGRSD
jgi:hypothetical protein